MCLTICGRIIVFSPNFLTKCVAANAKVVSYDFL